MADCPLVDYPEDIHEDAPFKEWEACAISVFLYRYQLTRLN